MAYADALRYEEMIKILRTYISQVMKECKAIEDAGRYCAGSAFLDNATCMSNEKLQKCVLEIRSATEPIHEIIAELQREIENNYYTASKVD